MYFFIIPLKNFYKMSWFDLNLNVWMIPFSMLEGIEKHDDEGRVITAEFEKFYLVTSCEYLICTFCSDWKTILSHKTSRGKLSYIDMNV